MDPGGHVGDAITLDALRGARAVPRHAEFHERVASITPDDTCVFMYTSGTTGPPKGCILTHGNYRNVVSMAEQQGVAQEGT